MSEINEAAVLVRRLVSHEAETMEREPAMRSVGRNIRAGYWTTWGLYHRRRKTVGADLMMKLRRAYLAFCRHEIEKLEAELLEQQKRCGNDSLENLAAEIAALAEKVRAASDQAYLLG